MIIKQERFSIDTVGKVFSAEGRFFRAIYKDAEQDVNELLQSGLLDELISKDLFPDTWISDVRIQDFDLVLEHKKIEHISMPYEWSFEMLRDAAICILDVAEICQNYGYGLHDTHNYNVIFDGSHPLFVDLGSLRKGNKFSDKIGNFIDYNYLPLKLFSIGEFTFAKRILSDEYIERFLPHKYYHESSLVKHLLKELYNVSLKNRVKAVLKLLNINYNQSLRHLTISDFREKITNLNKLTSKTLWGTYHNAYVKGDAIEIPDRFDKIINCIDELGVETVLDAAGNQGLLTILIKERCNKVGRVICLDYDENAIDKFYMTIKGTPSNRVLSPIHSNLLFPSHLNYYKTFYSRLNSELVLALAITHHLILTQGFSVEMILEQLTKLTSKYVLIEFMPLGTWGGGEYPPIPEWYTISWFRCHFEEYFNLLHEEQTEVNRIMLLGELK